MREELKGMCFQGIDEIEDETIFVIPQGISRSLKELVEVENELFEKLWYSRHLNRRVDVNKGEYVDPEIWEQALANAKKIEDKYSVDNWGCYSMFDLGLLCGELGAIRWILGDEWENLDT